MSTKAHAAIPKGTMRDIVTFEPDGITPFAEPHVMEHRLYALEGKAVCRLNQDWVGVEAGDYMWRRAICPQTSYAGGTDRFRYLLYKDVNRHMPLSLTQRQDRGMGQARASAQT